MNNKIMQLYKDNIGRAKTLISNKKTSNEASLYIYDVIDSVFGIGAKDVVNAIAEAGDAEVLHVYIKSPGGDVFEGRAMMAELNRFEGKTIAHIDSLCASAATSVALACDEVEMSDGAFFMIHNASGLVWGDKTDMREMASVLEKVEGAIIGDYVNKTGRAENEIIDWMNAETWFTAKEALNNGFIDRISDNLRVENTWNLAAYDNVPADLIAKVDTVTVDCGAGKDGGQELKNTMTQANKNKLSLTMIL